MPAVSVICGITVEQQSNRGGARMARCVNCGIENEGCLCDQCRNTVDLEELCKNVLVYRFGSGENPLWDEIAFGLSGYYNFQHVVFAIADELPSPRREYWKLLSLTGESSNITKYSRPWLYELNEKIKDMDGLTVTEQNRLKGIVLGALFMDYRYEEADRVAGELIEQDVLPIQAYYNLTDFYSKTRRYDEADAVMDNAAKIYGADQIQNIFCEIIKRNQKYREAEVSGKVGQYMPKPNENKEEAQKAYIDYLSSIGKEVTIPTTLKSRIPTPIPPDQYPEIKETRDSNFDTFIVYDLETTGRSTAKDAIIEIGAVKVSGGMIIESSEFTFQELVHPYKQKVSDDIVALTGITRDDVKEAREMWEVFPDFMKFAGDSVLV